MSEPLPHEVFINNTPLFLFTRDENPLCEEEPEYAAFLSAFSGSTENFAAGRLKEFYLGRSLLREALIKVTGADPGWIRAGDGRRPELPSGVAASLTHTHLHGHRIAVVAAARLNDLVMGIDLEPCFSELQAEKLRERFAGYFDSKKSNLGPIEMTELFTIYEASVKILSQKNRGIVSPSHLKLESKTADSWVISHPESGTRIEGILIHYRDARLALGIG